MSLIPQPTFLETGALAGAEAANHMATVMRSAYGTFWSREPAAIIAEITADIVKAGTIFTLNTQAGTAINTLLDAIADTRFTARAPVTLPAYWTFDANGISYDPPPPSEPSPDEQEP